MGAGSRPAPHQEAPLPAPPVRGALVAAPARAARVGSPPALAYSSQPCAQADRSRAAALRGDMPIFHSWETKEFEGYLLRKIKTEAETRDLSKKVKLPAHNEYNYDESPHEEEVDGQVGERFN